MTKRELLAEIDKLIRLSVATAANRSAQGLMLSYQCEAGRGEGLRAARALILRLPDEEPERGERQDAKDSV